ncbi:MAG: redoxin domain-containing protein [Gemmatimonadetes bacterium]|nr:redoxin domain-containing protein [Gemmatimonadota bacterium]
MTVRKGDRAPAFELPQGPGDMIDLGDFLGRKKVVLLFFPLAFSPVCTTELCTVSREWDEWEGLDARVFGISVDSPFVTSSFREEENNRYPILTDFNKRVSEEYGVLHEELLGLEGVSKRSVFVIDREGMVVYDWISEDPGVEPDYAEVKQAVKAA